MKTLALLLFFVLAEAAPSPEYFRFAHTVEGLSPRGGQNCFALDASVFAHSTVNLADLRLYMNGTETPYVLRTAQNPVAGRTQAFDLLNKGKRAGRTSFDAEIAGMIYSDLTLDVSARDFIATVLVTGSRDADRKNATRLGSFTIFDLSRQRLGRSTVLHLPASDLHYLHFEIAGPIEPEQVTVVEAERQSATVPVYRTVAATSQIERRGRKSVAVFTLPAHVPVDRVVIVPGAEPRQFSRAASVEVSLAEPPKDGSVQPASSALPGNLLRVHTVENNLQIDRESFTLDAPQNYFDAPTRWAVTIDNGDDAPLDLKQLRLEMRERKLCFEAAPSAPVKLFYGDTALVAPNYDYARLFVERSNATQATLGAEQNNPFYKARPDERTFTEKHPALLWIAMIAVVVLLGLIAIRSLPAIKSPS